jgi:hypothetical protein
MQAKGKAVSHCSSPTPPQWPPASIPALQPSARLLTTLLYVPSLPPHPLQFLPQDKVVEFARMKPVDLLEATEKVGGRVGGWVGGATMHPL